MHNAEIKKKLNDLNLVRIDRPITLQILFMYFKQHEVYLEPFTET